MAILLPNKDGTSAANVGDIVVTGGGIFEKTANGSVRRADLEAQTGYSGGVGDYRTLANTVYNTVRASIESSGRSSGGNNQSNGGGTMPPPDPVREIETSTDVNGIVTFDDFGFTGFDPNYYATNTSGTGTGVKTALGYVAVGLVGLVILDRIVSGGGR